MPEGPEIRRAADQLAVILKQPLTQVWFAFPALKPYESRLTGQDVLAIETRGKALLIHFTCGLTMYSHNQLYGVWKVVQAGETPQTRRDLRVRLENKDWAILLYSASDIEIWQTADIEQHPFLQRIGPDVLNTALTTEQVTSRLLDKVFRRRQLGALLLDQRFLAGLGNYLRAEILWASYLSPSHRPESLTSEQITLLSDQLLAIPRLSYQTRGTMDDSVHHGALFQFKVFDREGKPCERCHAPILRNMVTSRPFFYCPVCQT